MRNKMKIEILIIIVVLMVSLSMLTAQTQGDLHDGWDALLKKHVKEGKVNYKGFMADRKLFNQYLHQLNDADISSFSPQRKLAYWINAYNAFTVKLILLNYPVKGIRKISRPWKQKIWKAAGQTVSLDHIEHGLLRKMNEPRIHVAIVCASIGCPDLMPYAYTASKLDQQLSDACRGFFASPKHFSIKGDGDTVTINISKIFKWFGGDFGKSKKERAHFMQKYVDEAAAQLIKKGKSFKFKYTSYDWNLNQ